MAVIKLHRKRGHIIYKLANGTRVPGASTIAKVDEDYHHLLNWANDLGRQGLDHNKVREEASDAGSVCHFLIQCYLKQDTPDLSEFSPAVIALATVGYNKFAEWWEGEKLKLVACEVPLVSEEYRFGGTIDLVAVDPQEQYFLTDQKTSKNIYLSHLIQLSAYEHLWNVNNPAQKIKRACIVRIDRNETRDFEVRPVFFTEPYFNVFKAQLALYYAKKKI